jgi:hypothetical protein
MAEVKKKKQAKVEKVTRWPFGKKNYYLFGAALAAMIIGFVLLGYGSMTIAPILLVLGYCVLMPLAIIVKGRPEEAQAETAEAPKQE